MAKIQIEFTTEEVEAMVICLTPDPDDDSPITADLAEIVQDIFEDTEEFEDVDALNMLESVRLKFSAAKVKLLIAQS